MPSRGKKKTTMAKLSRESRLRERRIDKEARRDARRRAAAEGPLPDAFSADAPSLDASDSESVQDAPDGPETDDAPAVQASPAEAG